MKRILERARRSFLDHTDARMSAANAFEVVQTVTLALALVVLTGSTALAQTNNGLGGVSETGIYITLPIYVSSLFVVGAGCFTLGRWTSNLQRDLLEAVQRQAREAEGADAKNQKLEREIANLRARIESIDPNQHGGSD